ncbi:MAG: threonylcarbamoyl-AMP synthase [Bacteroidetes bacterium]|nr:threonylcarbamoyl-AMP synthase [Bacteroidota bacterium]
MPATRIIKISAENPDVQKIKEASEVLCSGGLVAFPTETVYGLGADALNTEAVQKIFKAKGRPSDNPLIVHIASLENIHQFAASVSEKGLQLAKRFWPGPLTLVFRKKENVPYEVTAGLETVALRIPDHSVTLELLRQFGGGIAGPSANVSGKPSPTSAEHVYNDLNGRIDLIIDAGPAKIGVESTVLDVTVDPPIVLRIGGLSREDIEKEISKVNLTDRSELLRRSPGTRHRHYATKAQVVLIPLADIKKFEECIKQYKEQRKKIGAITYSAILGSVDVPKFHVFLDSSIEHIARNLFGAMRELDRQNLDVILIESVEEKGLGAAVMDRLRKAAAHVG